MKNVLCILIMMIVIALLTASCRMEEGFLEGVGVEVMEQNLDDSRQQVIRECSQAMTGSWWSYDHNTWPTGTTYAGYAYTSADPGAWNNLLNADRYSGYGYKGFYVSCMRYRSEGYLPFPYTVCSLSPSTGYGSFEMPNYTCQGNCASGYKRGGQCKPFMNLVAYRSGIYQDPGYAFKAFPSDMDIKYGSTAPDQMPWATYATIEPGDFLRRPGGHALIVVRKISSAQVIVLDSNWLNGGSGYGDGKEIVGSHSMAFTGGGGDTDLGAYRILKCVYSKKC